MVCAWYGKRNAWKATGYEGISYSPVGISVLQVRVLSWLLKLKTMELILYGIIGSLVGSLIVLITINLFKSKPSIDCQELIKQSEERLEKSKKYGKELDRMLEEMKK